MFKVWGHSAYSAGFPVIAALMASVTPALAGLDTTVAFNLPAGDLARTLVTISRQGGIMISFPPEVVAGRQSAALQGSLTVREAIARALAGTGLRMVPGAGGVTVVADTGAGSTAAAADLGDVAAIDVTDQGGGSRFGDVGFQAGDAGDTVRIGGAPAKEIPLVVNTVTSNVIRSQNLTTATDAVQNISNVSVSAASGGGNSFIIRGIQTSDVFVNGQGVSSGAANNPGFGQIPIDDVERVEVLKGPSSILTGAVSGGGGINITTKQPTSQEIRDMVVRYGSYGYRTLAFDLGGPIKDLDGVTYRLNISGNTANENYAGYRDPHQALISPVIKWEDGKTSILLGLRYVDERRPPNQFTFAPSNTNLIDSPYIRIPRGTPLINPLIGNSIKSLQIYSDQSHHFGDFFGFDTTFNNKIFYEQSSIDFKYFTFSGRNGPAPGMYATTPTYLQYHFDRITNRSDVTMVYDAGFGRQTSKFGIDFFSSYVRTASSPAGVFFLNPVTGFPGRDLFETPSTVSGRYSSIDARGLGYYYMNKFDTLDDRLHILGQVRFDQNYYQNSSGFKYAETKTAATYPSGLSWLAGAAFDVTPYFTVYGNRTNGWLPINGTLGNTNALSPPEIQEKWEAGGRFFLFDKKLTITSAYFEQNSTNYSICNPDDPSCSTVILINGLSSKGAELDFQGELFSGMNVIGSFGTAVSKFQDVRAGNLVTTVPQYTASLWATYTFQDGPMQGLTLGFGGLGNSNSGNNLFTTNNNGKSVNTALKLPGYIVANALIGYDYDKWSIQFNVKNIFDKYYYQPSFSSNYVGIGQGRTFLLTARYSFD